MRGARWPPALLRSDTWNPNPPPYTDHPIDSARHAQKPPEEVTKNMFAEIGKMSSIRPSMPSRQNGVDRQWFMEQFVEELENKWNEFTFEMVLAVGEENAKTRRE
jgi:hypothetical protein